MFCHGISPNLDVVSIPSLDRSLRPKKVYFELQDFQLADQILPPINTVVEVEGREYCSEE